MFITAIIVILSTLLLYVLFAPFYIEINSPEKIYQFRFHRLAVVSINLTDSSLFLDIKILFWKKRLDLLSKNKPDSPKKKQNKQAKKRNIGSFNFKKLKAIVKSFKVNRCDINIDTGNMHLNGMLFPLAYLMGRYFKKNIKINFMNKNIIILEIENNLAKMAYAYVK